MANNFSVNVKGMSRPTVLELSRRAELNAAVFFTTFFAQSRNNFFSIFQTEIFFQKCEKLQNIASVVQLISFPRGVRNWSDNSQQIMEKKVEMRGIW